MHLLRLVSVASLIAASAAFAQLPPSFLLPGRPAQPIVAATPMPAVPVVPTPAAPATPATPATPAAPIGKLEFRNATPNALVPAEQAQGWRLLFDGQRLTGLRGVQRSDPLSSGWIIRAGELALPKEVKNMDRMTGGDLITTEQYWDFDFRFDWKASVSSDSGIRYLLSESSGQTPSGLEYQIIDDVHSPLGLKGGLLRRSGALDNVLPVGKNAVLRSADPLNNRGDPWNEGRIVVQGSHVEHWLNGEKVLEFELGSHLRRLAEAKKMRVAGSFGMKNRTRLCILDQGTEVAFRNLKIRPLIPQALVAPGSGANPSQPQQPVPNPLLLPPGAAR